MAGGQVEDLLTRLRSRTPGRETAENFERHVGQNPEDVEGPATEKKDFLKLLPFTHIDANFSKMGQPRPLFHLFSSFLQQIYVKNVHPVYGAGI